MTLRLLLVALLTACMPLATSAKEDPPNPVSAAFGDSSAPVKDPFPAEALELSVKSGCPGLLNQRMTDLRGRTIDLCAFRGKVVLVVNTASHCGYTPQYKGLQALQARYATRGLVVLGFPSNDFGEQEPGSNQDIEQFCEANYGVTFPLFGKVTVRGPQKVSLFRTLTATKTLDVAPGEVQWNFEKFLIGRDGALLARFRSAVEPESGTLIAPLERALGS